MESEIDEDIATGDALDIDGDGGDSDVRGDEFELHMNANETEYPIEEYSIIGEWNVEKGSHKNFLKVKTRGSMEVIGKIAVDSSMSFEGVKIPSTPDDYGRGPAQDVPFFYTPSHLSELQSFKSIISTHFLLIFIFK